MNEGQGKLFLTWMLWNTSWNKVAGKYNFLTSYIQMKKMEKLCAMTYEVDTQEHGLTKHNVVIELMKEA